MKIILTGSTGFIGSEVLTQCLASPYITSITAISRRRLPDSISSNPKLQTVILDDFTTYTDEVLRGCVGAEACIWSLGIKKYQSPAGESGRTINLDYTLAAAKAFQKSLATRLGDQKKRNKFRFVYCSGIIAERDQEKSLWFMDEGRKMRGEVENQLIAIAREHPDTFESFIVRPGAVLARGNVMPNPLISLTRSVRIEELAAAMVGIATEGSGEQIVESWKLREMGQALLRDAPKTDQNYVIANEGNGKH